MTNALSKLTLTQLQRALEIREQIEGLMTQLDQIQGAPAAALQAEAGPKSRRRVSAAARRKMKAAQRTRRAAERGDIAPAKATRRRKRKLSPAVRARLSAIAAARWARVRAAGKTRL